MTHTKGTPEYRREHLLEMLKLPLDKKIEHAKKRIKEFYEAQDGKVYVAYSGGKDSTALLHLVRSMYPEVPAVFSNTTNEFPEILQHVRSTDNMVWLEPKMTFNETIREYGFPLISKLSARKVHTIKHSPNSNTANLYRTGVNMKGGYSQLSKLANKWMFMVDAPFDITNKCCDILKKNPMKIYEKESGLKPIIGTQTSESGMRQKSWIDTGCNTFEGSKISSRPLSIWTEEDIWQYIHDNDVIYSSIYDDLYDKEGNIICKGETRTGCAYCAYGLNLEKADELGMKRFDRLEARKPKQFSKTMDLENNGVSFREALEFTYKGNK